jgi:formylmethanofuran dehydrogenase subunit E
MAMLGCREVNIDEPRGCKKLVVYVEIDRCATDAIQAVTGCSLGKRTLKFLDYGKMAAIFVNTETQQAIRVLAKDDARDLVPQYVLNGASPRDAQKQAYRVMPDETLFSVQSVALHVPAQEMPDHRGTRIQCAECSEEINFHREVNLGGRKLCIPCAQGGLLPVGTATRRLATKPKVLLVVGYKKVGKTSLIEKLIPELSNRGYRVATVKHHHSDFPVTVDAKGSDTWRHRQAGAASVALATPTGIALFRDNDGSLSLDEIVSALGANDIVLVEGFHEEPGAKIEVRSERTVEALCKTDENLLAIVTPRGCSTALPSFEPNSIKPLADLIEREVLARP